MTQNKADDMKLVGSVQSFARSVVRRSNTITAIRTQHPEVDDASPVDLSMETLDAANEISETLYRVADLSGADGSVLVIAAGKLLAKFATFYGEDPKKGDPEDRGTENAVMLAAAGFVLGLEAFIRDIQEARENLDDEDYEDDEDIEAEDDGAEENDDSDDDDVAEESDSEHDDLDVGEDESSEPPAPETSAEAAPASPVGLAIKHQN